MLECGAERLWNCNGCMPGTIRDRIGGIYPLSASVGCLVRGLQGLRRRTIGLSEPQQAYSQAEGEIGGYSNTESTACHVMTIPLPQPWPQTFFPTSTSVSKERALRYAPEKARGSWRVLGWLKGPPPASPCPGTKCVPDLMLSGAQRAKVPR